MKEKHRALSLHNRERRRFSRVPFDRSAWLTIHNRKQRFDRVENLSMGGVCILGKTPLQTGDICDCELHDDGDHSCRIVRFCARVLRIREDCVALEFVDMDVDSYMFLQTMVLYYADDPLGVVTEFQDNFPRPSISVSC
jgi:hypothetical protein